MKSREQTERFPALARLPQQRGKDRAQSCPHHSAKVFLDTFVTCIVESPISTKQEKCAFMSGDRRPWRRCFVSAALILTLALQALPLRAQSQLHPPAAAPQARAEEVNLPKMACLFRAAHQTLRVFR